VAGGSDLAPSPRRLCLYWGSGARVWVRFWGGELTSMPWIPTCVNKYLKPTWPDPSVYS
jgi:hypothetical protein